MDPFKIAKIGGTGVQLTRLGLGGAPLGAPGQSDQQAVAGIRHALDLGIRYVDTAPFYGAGRSEMRFGRALANVPRDSFVISTKVGRLLKLNGTEEIDFKHLSLGTLPQLTAVFDFRRDAILRSIEQSLDRLGLERVDILFFHDVPQEHYQTAIEDAYPMLAELRSRGRVKAIGAGLGSLDLLVRFAREGDFDCFILPWRYTLLDQTAISEFLPVCVEKGISIIIGAPYDGGRMSGQVPAKPEMEDQLRRLTAVCRRHQVPIKAAALQFVAAHPAVVSVIPGPRSTEEVEDNIRMMQHPVPPVFWDDLRDQGLIALESPTPAE